MAEFAAKMKRGRGRPFKPGQSGNPRGKLPGTLARATQIVRAMAAGDLEAVVQKLVDQAKAGDVAAARLLLDRLCPAPKDSPIQLPELAARKLETAGDVAQATGAVLARMGAGEITPATAQQVCAILTVHRENLEVADFEARLSAMELKMGVEK